MLGRSGFTRRNNYFNITLRDTNDLINNFISKFVKRSEFHILNW